MTVSGKPFEGPAISRAWRTDCQGSTRVRLASVGLPPLFAFLGSGICGPGHGHERQYALLILCHHETLDYIKWVSAGGWVWPPLALVETPAQAILEEPGHPCGQKSCHRGSSRIALVCGYRRTGASWRGLVGRGVAGRHLAKKNAPAERTSRMASVFAGIAGQGPGAWFNLYVELSSTCYQSLRGAGLV